MSEHQDLAAEMGQQLRHLINLAADPNDPQAIILGEEVAHLSHDDSSAVLFCALLMIARYEEQGVPGHN